MKGFNKNSILFFFALLFLAAGLWGESFAHLGEQMKAVCSGLGRGDIGSVFDFRTYANDTLSKQLRYHSTLVDVNSIRENLLGTRVIRKDSSTVVKADSGSLMGVRRKIAIDDIREAAALIAGLKDAAEENEAGFLYCAAPTKEQFETAPPNFTDNSRENFADLLTCLTERDIPYIDLAETLRETDLSESELFYRTDHHWKAYSGFVVTGAICVELKDRYGFSYDAELTDIRNYNIKTYPHWFLGSLGKKTGTYFTRNGADDFQLITPGFDTDMTEEQPAKKQVRQGGFEDTVLYVKNLKRDLYGVNTYATYSGGDFRLQIIRNNKNPGGKKILLVRDSYACVVAPFLALQAAELYVCDMRDLPNFVGEKLNMRELIESVKPDYVLVLYSGISAVKSSSGKFDFF